MKKTYLLVAIVVALSGCTKVTRKADGSWSYTSALSRKSAKRVSVTTPDGTKMTLEGYQNDQVEVIGVATEAAVRGAVTAAKGGTPLK